MLKLNAQMLAALVLLSMLVMAGPTLIALVIGGGIVAVVIRVVWYFTDRY